MSNNTRESKNKKQMVSEETKKQIIADLALYTPKQLVEKYNLPSTQFIYNLKATIKKKEAKKEKKFEEMFNDLDKEYVILKDSFEHLTYENERLQESQKILESLYDKTFDEQLEVKSQLGKVKQELGKYHKFMADMVMGGISFGKTILTTDYEKIDHPASDIFRKFGNDLVKLIQQEVLKHYQENGNEKSDTDGQSTSL